MFFFVSERARRGGIFSLGSPEIIVSSRLDWNFFPLDKGTHTQNDLTIVQQNYKNLPPIFPPDYAPVARLQHAGPEISIYIKKKSKKKKKKQKQVRQLLSAISKEKEMQSFHEITRRKRKI